jgi:hypothetical protein
MWCFPRVSYHEQDMNTVFFIYNALERISKRTHTFKYRNDFSLYNCYKREE